MTTMHKIKWFTLSAIAILFVIVAVQNTGATIVQFIGWKFEVPRMALISGVALGGFVAGALAVLLVQRNQYQLHQPPVEPSPQDSKVET